jgi:hypothetical protein
LDSNADRTDTATDDVAQKGATDGAVPSNDGGDVDAGRVPVLAVSPNDVPMIVGMGVPSQPVVFTVSNVGSESSGAFTVTLTGSKYFKISSNACAKPLPAGESCKVLVVFDAPGGAGGPISASLKIAAYGFPGGVFTVVLSGDAV